MAAAWPDIFVHDSNLKVNMSSLRRSLGDTQIEPVYIATVAAPRLQVHRGCANLRRRGRGRSGARRTGFRCPARHCCAASSAAKLTSLTSPICWCRSSTSPWPAPEGVGKTTVAVAAAQAFASQCRDGVCFVDLATISDPTLFGTALVTALGIRGNPDNSTGRGSGLSAAAADADRSATIASTCCRPPPSLPASSWPTHRRPNCWRRAANRLALPPNMSCGSVRSFSPRPGDALTADQALRFPAIQLFVRRAAEWSGLSFRRSRLRGYRRDLPFARRSAAGHRTGSRADRNIQPARAGGDARSRISAFGPRAPKARRRAMKPCMATIDWSFKLLSPKEATLFGLLSVFSAAFEAEDAAFVAETAGLTPVDVVTGLGSLVAKSLVSAQARGAEPALSAARQHAALCGRAAPGRSCRRRGAALSRAACPHAVRTVRGGVELARAGRLDSTVSRPYRRSAGGAVMGIRREGRPCFRNQAYRRGNHLVVRNFHPVGSPGPVGNGARLGQDHRMR